MAQQTFREDGSHPREVTPDKTNRRLHQQNQALDKVMTASLLPLPSLRIPSVNEPIASIRPSLPVMNRPRASVYCTSAYGMPTPTPTPTPQYHHGNQAPYFVPYYPQYYHHGHHPHVLFHYPPRYLPQHPSQYPTQYPAHFTQTHRYFAPQVVKDPNCGIGGVSATIATNDANTVDGSKMGLPSTPAATLLSEAPKVLPNKGAVSPELTSPKTRLLPNKANVQKGQKHSANASDTPNSPRTSPLVGLREGNHHGAKGIGGVTKGGDRISKGGDRVTEGDNNLIPLLPTNPPLSKKCHKNITVHQFGRNITWEKNFETLLKFRDEHGHCYVPATYPTNREFSRWVKYQRNLYHAKMAGDLTTSLTDERQSKLDEAGFIWDLKSWKWMKRYEELKQFIAENSHCNLTTMWKTNRALVLWIRNQREQYQLLNGRASESRMTQKRVDMLEALGDAWCWD